MKIGPKKSIALACAFMVIAVFLSLLPSSLFWNTLGWGYLTVIFADAVFIFVVLSAFFRDPHKTQQLIKCGMLLALISFALGGIT